MYRGGAPRLYNGTGGYFAGKSRAGPCDVFDIKTVIHYLFFIPKLLIFHSSMTTPYRREILRLPQRNFALTAEKFCAYRREILRSPQRNSALTAEKFCAHRRKILRSP
jgi:hypothetical protein